MRAWNSSNVESAKWRTEYGPNSSQRAGLLHLLQPLGIASRVLAGYTLGGPLVIADALVSWGGERGVVKHIPQQVEVEQMALQSLLQGRLWEETVLKWLPPPIGGEVPWQWQSPSSVRPEV